MKVFNNVNEWDACHFMLFLAALLGEIETTQKKWKQQQQLR